MAYNSTGLVVHDADAHIMEPPNWLRDHADPAIRDRIAAAALPERQRAAPDRRPRRAAGATSRRRSTGSPTATAAPSTSTPRRRRSWTARTSPPPGSFLPEDRPRALDLLGFASQLVFNTFHNRRLHDWEHAGDLELAIGAARAHNRGMVEFCAVDPRLLPTCYVPLADLDARRRDGRRGDRDGRRRAARRVGLPAGPLPQPRRPRPGLGGGQRGAASRSCSTSAAPGDLIDPNYFRNGLPVPPDFHGGEENFRSVDYMGIPGPPAQTLATMIFDGVFERFPDLRVGVIEQGAIWVPSWMRQMESAFDAFARHEERLRALSMRPSEYVRRQIRFTPYPTEDVGWIIEQAGPEVCLFSSDYPHVEGGRRPIERFERRSATPTSRPAGLLPRQLRRPDGRRARHVGVVTMP